MSKLNRYKLFYYKKKPIENRKITYNKTKPSKT